MPEEKRCELKVSYRYTWPGRDEDVICQECSERLSTVANALGLHLQLIPIESDETCPQHRR